MIVILIILYLIPILLIGIIMGRKGRDLGKEREIGPVTGFWLGFLLGRIGLFIVKRSPITEPLHTSPPNTSTVTTEEPDVNKTQSLDEPKHETVQEPPGDESIFTSSKQEDDTYLDQLAIEVCLHGENLEKYERMVTKQYDHDVYVKLQRFVEEVSRSHQRQLFTNTSIANLRYLGQIVGLRETTVNEIINQLK